MMNEKFESGPDSGEPINSECNDQSGLKSEDNSGGQYFKPNSPEDRKNRSERILQDHHVLINRYLPLTPDSKDIHWRSPRTAAGRALALSYVILTAFDLVRPDWVFSDLEQYRLSHLITPAEITFLKEPAEGRKRVLTWRSESLWTILWSLNVVRDLGFPNSMIRLSDIPKGEFPIDPDEDPNKYLDRFSSLRPAEELTDALDFYYRALWACRNGVLHMENECPINTAIVFERYYALNWLRCYNGKDWDHVPTDL